MKIFLIGFMGTGKTHWGRKLSEKLDIPFFDLDEQIVLHEKKSINQIFADNGEEYFRLLEKDMLHIVADYQETFVLACGGGTPCFYNNIDYMNSKGISVWLNTSVGILFKRLLKEKEKRPLLRDLCDEELKGYILKKLADRKIYYEQAGIIVDEDTLTLDILIEKLFHA